LPDPCHHRQPRPDFLGAFGVLERGDGILMVQNRRRIDGADVLVWDLPGGQVEPRELLQEALVRELGEEVGIEVAGTPQFLFFQEGERIAGGRRLHAWRSFFFAVREWRGTPRARGEVLAARWVMRAKLSELLVAPYHDSFARWLAGGGTSFASRWEDGGPGR
jgi:ADP-ribose pyrophosphatase YjhB (NUDIX family)